MIRKEHRCPVFGVKSGGPVICLGIMLILFAITPYLILPRTMPALMAMIFAGFGIFLIWAGIAK